MIQKQVRIRPSHGWCTSKWRGNPGKCQGLVLTKAGRDQVTSLSLTCQFEFRSQPSNLPTTSIWPLPAPSANECSRPSAM